MSKKKPITKSDFINRYLHDQLNRKLTVQEVVQKKKFAKDYTKRKKEEKDKRRKGQMVIVERDSRGKVLFTDRHVKDIVERYNACETMTEIGKRYGVSRQTIREALKKAGEL